MKKKNPSDVTQYALRKIRRLIKELDRRLEIVERDLKGDNRKRKK
jgi:hypothetical protein